MWYLVLLLLAKSEAAQTKCRALALSGGGSWGSYEGGVLRSFTNLLSAEETSYNFVVGTSAGAMNSLMMSQYPTGQEKQAVDFMQNLWFNINNSAVFQSWSGGIVDGLLYRPGLFDDSPLKRTMHGYIQTTLQRNISVGTCDLQDGTFYNFDQTIGLDNMVEATVCSASIPAFFPFQNFGGKQFIDGGTDYSIDIFTAVDKCLQVTPNQEEITVDMISCHHYHLQEESTDYKTFDVYSRTNSIKSYDKGMYELYYAFEAYPNVNFRYYVMPSTGLEGIPLEFGREAVSKSWNQGIGDSKNCIEKNIYAKDILNDWIANGGGKLSSKGIVHATE